MLKEIIWMEHRAIELKKAKQLVLQILRLTKALPACPESRGSSGQLLREVNELGAIFVASKRTAKVGFESTIYNRESALAHEVS
ncbi:MAG TPA: hypothetical protein VGF08_13185 [Terriglobales bacterium]